MFINHVMEIQVPSESLLSCAGFTPGRSSLWLSQVVCVVCVCARVCVKERGGERERGREEVFLNHLTEGSFLWRDLASCVYAHV